MLRLCLFMMFLYAAAYCFYFGHNWGGVFSLLVAALLFAQAFFQGAADSLPIGDE
ncbi:hypothetical protein [uncultured Sulfitobacter sp.]|uniref:hypothetical protein n=1 Tax=uncultured Sulfitobacter sp. TaxID=191468 RepID=UPI0025995C46|nr:hypothetical protein [uncultured Sulfitobacter sp.]